ncbi:MAG: hypothetical protein B6U78_00480 [Candidatus Aenigmarchaeota archaeon ex4484_224]|nr:MAG: hypothetical protein B6U78_00480 [Candidatus Aenigmarchaeota archaeon ex4484_224]
MREFILLSRRGYTKPFDINDLPKAGRIDLVSRFILSSIFISEKLRENVKVYVVLEGPPNPPKLITFDSNLIKRIYPSEIKIAEKINNALKKYKENQIIESEPGIFIQKKSFERLIKEFLENHKKLVYLSRKGILFKQFQFEENSCFIIGDHVGLDKKRELFLKRLKIPFVSLGRISYLSSQVVSIIHFILDNKFKF